jgi:hypothetical protein
MKSGSHKENPTERKCSICKVIKPIKDFGICRSRYFGYNYRCKQCRQLLGRKISIKYNYGITIQEFDRILIEQGGVCAICGKSEDMLLNGTPTRLSVDHNHSTGKVRGILCRKCNVGIGYFNDDVSLLERAYKYLSKFQ